MSRNFDILQKAQGDAAFRPMGAPARELRGNGRTNGRSGRATIEDEIVKLAQRVFILPGEAKAPAAVAFCGINRSAGCSWVCARVSEVLADQQSGSVCLVDANLRAPSLHAHFRFEASPGFVDAVGSAQPIREFARSVAGANLWLVPSGGSDNRQNGALPPDRIRARIMELRREFDYVLIDTPAIDSYGDAVLLGQSTDGVVLVVDSSATRRAPARIAKEAFEAAKIPVLGAVLNKRTFPIPEPLYRKL